VSVTAELGTVIVTGGASGLGAAVAAAVAAEGGTPVVLDLHDPADGLAAERVDLARPREAEAAVRRVADAHGGLDAVVTAAGTDACGDIGDVDPDAWDRVVAVNLLGTAAVVRAALPYLERSRGRVVTVASTLGLRALPAATAYCASKFGVVGFTRALAAELGDRVGVTMLVPGGMRTPLSTITRRSRACRPTRTPGIRMLSSTVLKLCTRTLGQSTLPRMVLPEMMQPAEISESSASPERRPSSAKTNFAGGACTWCVRTGHSGS
jgi:NAD(P)-dependent dehydrogenase (short-subunit alcohol dehydrogenase family)